MSKSEWEEVLRNQGAAFADDGSVDHFGNPSDEWMVARRDCVAVPLLPLVRIRVSGDDRAKFLHNFCTNDINGLEDGRVCEAFFTDVKAHVIAHGFVLSGSESHEIWMLGGDEERLVNHLSRYVITEDVTIESVSDRFQSVALMGPKIAELPELIGVDVDTWSVAAIGQTRATLMRTQWADIPMILLSADLDNITDVWQSVVDHPAGMTLLQHVRLLERFPLVGVDVSSDHLAPEADRNSTAISYTKGCYLGQEPIARIDAIGHVNRKLVRLKIDSGKLALVDNKLPGLLTSVSAKYADEIIALAVVKLTDINADGSVVIDSTVGLTAEVF